MSDRTITVGQAADGDPYELPIEEIRQAAAEREKTEQLMESL